VLSMTNGTARELGIEQAAMQGKGRIGPWLRSREYAVFSGERWVSPGRTGTIAVIWSLGLPLTLRMLRAELRFRQLDPESLSTAELALPFSTAPEPTVAAYATL